VHHCGMMTRGSYCCTLSEVEINTHWTELRALRNKAHQWTYKALVNIDKMVPFKIHSRHVDNGSEFINEPRKYEIDIPYNRVLKSTEVTKEKKQELGERKGSLSYLEILQKIIKLQLKLDRVYRKKYNPHPEDEE